MLIVHCNKNEAVRVKQMSTSETPTPAAKAKKAKPAVSAPVQPVATAPVKAVAAEPAVPAEPIVTPPAPVAPAAIEGSQTMTDFNTTTETFKNDVADKAQAAFADINERAKAAVEKSQKFAEDLAEFHKGNLEALVASGKVAAQGFETLGQDYAEYGRKSFESATAALKNLAAVKSPTEFFKLQGDYAKSAFETIVAQTSKNAEASLKLAGEVAQPLSNRVAVAAEKFKTAA